MASSRCSPATKFRRKQLRRRRKGRKSMTLLGSTSGAVSHLQSSNRLLSTCQLVISSLPCVSVSSASSALFARCLPQRQGLSLATFTILLQHMLACIGRSKGCTRPSTRNNIISSRSVTAPQSSTGDLTQTSWLLSIQSSLWK